MPFDELVTNIAALELAIEDIHAFISSVDDILVVQLDLRSKTVRALIKLKLFTLSEVINWLYSKEIETYTPAETTLRAEVETGLRRRGFSKALSYAQIVYDPLWKEVLTESRKLLEHG